MKPEIGRYEWVIIKHPELASSASDRAADANAPDSDENMYSLPLEAPPNSGTDSTHLSPFLAARHFHLNARNTSMFMAGNFDSIIIGEWHHAVASHYNIMEWHHAVATL